MGREIISLHVGAAGCRLGDVSWQLYNLEHDIDSEGRMVGEASDRQFTNFYAEMESEKFTPRAVFVDMDTEVIDEIRSGPNKDLLPAEAFVRGREGSGGLFSRAYYTAGRALIDDVIERVRTQADACDSLQGFQIVHSLGGGTGSGLTARIMDRLSSEFGKCTKIQFAIYPHGDNCISMVEPYNVVLNTHFAFQQTDVAFLFENEAIFDICRTRLDMGRPSMKDTTRVIAHVMSAINSTLRFESESLVNLDEFRTSLVPYPRLHFPLVSYSPFVTQEQVYSCCADAGDITRACFKPTNQMVKCNPLAGKYMTCCLGYRGDVTPRAVNQAVSELKSEPEIRFVDWSPKEFKVSVLNKQISTPIGGVMGASRQSALAMCNNTAMASLWSRLRHKFDVMYAKRAFVHWYVREGMEEGEFNDARDNMAALERDYEEVGAN